MQLLTDVSGEIKFLGRDSSQSNSSNQYEKWWNNGLSWESELIDLSWSDQCSIYTRAEATPGDEDVANFASSLDAQGHLQVTYACSTLSPSSPSPQFNKVIHATYDGKMWQLSNPIFELDGVREFSHSFDSQGHPSIAYVNGTDKVKYTEWNGISWSSPELIGEGRFVSLDSSFDQPQIAIMQSNGLAYATYIDGNWNLTTLPTQKDWTAIDLQKNTPATSSGDDATCLDHPRPTQQVCKPVIMVDSQGKPHIAHTELLESTINSTQKYFAIYHTYLDEGTWHEDVSHETSQGYSLAQYQSQGFWMELGDDDKPRILYINTSGQLNYSNLVYGHWITESTPNNTSFPSINGMKLENGKLPVIMSTSIVNNGFYVLRNNPSLGVDYAVTISNAVGSETITLRLEYIKQQPRFIVGGDDVEEITIVTKRGESMSWTAPLQTNSNAQVEEWSVYPPLPDGLYLSNGVISGELVASTTIPTTHLLWANNSGGGDSVYLIIKQTEPDGTVTYPTNQLSFVTGQSTRISMTPILANDTTPYMWKIDRSLPIGLSLNKFTGEISGAPFEPTIGQQDYTITAYVNSTDTGLSQQEISIAINVNDPIPQFNYHESEIEETENSSIRPIIPSISSIGIDSWNITPELFPGLEFDEASGVITGTPTTSSDRTRFSVTAYGVGVSTTHNIYLTIHQDTDLDTIPNNIDSDDDGDGTPDNHDSFPLDSCADTDTDWDGMPDSIASSCTTTLIADSDDDGDGISDAHDAFPQDPSETLDTDGDGVGNVLDNDDDGDGFSDSIDAFPLDKTEWFDTDGDGLGNNLDTDDDGDGWADIVDELPQDASDYSDSDGDGLGDIHDADDDDDGIGDAYDAFPLDSSEQYDTDGDGIGNNADSDDDDDGIPDVEDLFPTDVEDYEDFDSDGVGDNRDLDDDGDGYLDQSDAFRLNSNEWLDTDNDGIGNNADSDDDGDGVNDSLDQYPLDYLRHLDTDGDGIANFDDDDDDGDGYSDVNDRFSLDSSEWNDTDGDGIGDNSDPDIDNDSILNENDAFPYSPSSYLDSDNDGIPDNLDDDDDGDGFNDARDAFRLLASEWLDTDNDGLGNNADPDDDNDGVPDIIDSFPLNYEYFADTDNDTIPNKLDLDIDGDNVININDKFPMDGSEWLDTDLDSIGNNADLDDDGDGTSDDHDAFPLDSNEWLDTDTDGLGNLTLP